jgi:hypothetical protein
VIRHVAVFRFAPAFTAEQREHWMSLLRALPAQIPELRSISVGTEIVGSTSRMSVSINTRMNQAAAPGLAAERLSMNVAWGGTRGSPVTVAVTYEAPVASLLAGWLLPGSVSLSASATMRRAPVQVLPLPGDARTAGKLAHVAALSRARRLKARLICSSSAVCGTPSTS